MTDPNTSPSRRAMLAAALVGGGAAAAALAGAPAAQAVPGEASGRATAKNQFTLTVLGTTDLHNNVFNWDYFKNVPLCRRRREQDRDCPGRDPDQRHAGRARRGQHPDHRRRRHHPGHAPGLLLRQDQPHLGNRETPHGAGHERDRLRRRGAGQPRVQLRHWASAHLGAAAGLPAVGRQCARRRVGRASLHPPTS